jgi:hypothetical protein
MPYSDDNGHPRVFLSFAGSDRLLAERLAQDLRARGARAFVDEQTVRLGGNIVIEISRALSQSDYFVLLWSRAAVDRPWVEAEWSAALTYEVAQRRAFLFIVCLDRTPVPLLLAPRRCLQAVDHTWNEVVHELMSAWRRDWQMRDVQVLPAPFPSPVGSAGSLVLYVRNRDLGVAHVLTVPAGSDGWQLEQQVRTGLGLRESEARFGGKVGMHFDYRLTYAGEPIPAEKTLADLRITDGATIQLEVQVEPFGPDGSFPRVTYRKVAASGFSPALRRSLLNSAFGHLMPR